MKTDKASGKRRRMLGGERVRRSFRTEVSPLATLVRVLPLARVKRATRAYPVHKRYRHLSGGNRQAIVRLFPPQKISKPCEEPSFWEISNAAATVWSRLWSSTNMIDNRPGYDCCRSELILSRTQSASSRAGTIATSEGHSCGRGTGPLSRVVTNQNAPRAMVR